jgi:hypothetical protein
MPGGELRRSGAVLVTPSARPAWPRWWPAGLAWALWALTMLGLAATAWLDHLLRQAGLPDLTSLSASSIPVVVAAVSAATVGALLAARRPAHPVGWLLLGLGLSLIIHDLTYSYTRYGLVARPGALPAASYLAGFNNGIILSWLSQKIGCGPSTAPRTASRRSSALVLEHGFAERRHANDDPEARPATFQVMAGEADHFAAGIQQRTVGVVTPSSLVTRAAVLATALSYVRTNRGGSHGARVQEGGRDGRSGRRDRVAGARRGVA